VPTGTAVTVETARGGDSEPAGSRSS
jgi:hypothetical protein